MITVQAISHFEELKISALHHDLLHSEMHAAINGSGEVFHGIQTDKKAYALFHSKVPPDLEKEIIAARPDYEKRFGPKLRESVVETIRSNIGNEAAEIAPSDDATQRIEAIVQQLAAPLDPRDPKLGERIAKASTDPRVVRLRAALAYYSAAMNQFGIREKILADLQSKFGDRILNLALNGNTGDAVVSIRGDVDPAHIAKAHEVAAKHDPDKAAAPVKEITLEERIAALEAQLAKK